MVDHFCLRSLSSEMMEAGIIILLILNLIPDLDRCFVALGAYLLALFLGEIVIRPKDNDAPFVVQNQYYTQQFARHWKSHPPVNLLGGKHC